MKALHAGQSLRQLLRLLQLRTVQPLRLRTHIAAARQALPVGTAQWKRQPSALGLDGAMTLLMV